MRTAGTVPNHDAVKPDSNSPSWLEVPMNIELTALTLPRISSGVCSWTRLPDHDADDVGRAEDEERRDGEGEGPRDGEEHGGEPEDGYGGEHRPPDPASQGPARQEQGHGQRAHGGSGAQDA
jgi:hypothetical protein